MSRFFICVGTAPNLQYLSRKQSGDYAYYWNATNEQAVKFSNTRGIPEVGIDISDAKWISEDGVIGDYVF